MPLYDYKCANCHHVVEVRHGFNESYDGVCPSCGGPVQRVFNPAPIVFKGSGFYVTDSRGGGGSKEAKSPSESVKGESAAGESKPAGEGSSGVKKSDPAGTPAKGSSDSAA